MKNHLKAAKFFIIVLLAFSLSCTKDSSGGDSDNPDDSSNNSVFRTETTPAVTDSRGRVELEFSLPESSTKFLVSIEGSRRLFFEFTKVENDRGDDFITPGGVPLSFADLPFSWLNVANVPSRSIDPGVDQDDIFSIQALVTTSENGRVAREEDVSIRVNSRADADLGRGRLPLNIFRVGGPGRSSDAAQTIDSALDVGRDIMRSQANIELDVSIIDIDGPSVLPLPDEGSSFYETASTSAPTPAVNVFIGGDIENTQGSVLGIAAGIPGPAHPSPRSGVAISLVAGAGPDGQFDQSDINLLGETIVHEAGHYMGLFHPIDAAQERIIGEDPLPDTATCQTISECLGNSELAGNNLFPFPIIAADGQPIRQNLLTPQQAGVLNRYVVVD